MPANKIRRSDAGSDEKYDRLADKLNSILEQKIPKFYDYGRASGMNDGDTLEVPTFTSNMIDLAVLGPQPERTAAKEDSPREARTKKRHLIAQVEINEFPSEEIVQDKGDILSSIEALLPTSNNNSNMNKTANSLIHGLIDTLKIEDGQKEWFKAQVSDGVVSNQVFLRNLRASLQNNGGK
jgi:hypothetical protein